MNSSLFDRSTEVGMSFAMLAITAAGRAPIKNVQEVERILLQFGKRVYDPQLRAEVIKFQSLEQFNAAKFAISRNAQRAAPADCASAREFIAAIRGGVLLWLIPDAVKECSQYGTYWDLMLADDIVGLSNDAA